MSWTILSINLLSEVRSLCYWFPLSCVVQKVSATSDPPGGFNRVPRLAPRSPEVEGQGHCKDDAHEHQKRQPGLQKACTAGERWQENQGEETSMHVVMYTNTNRGNEPLFFYEPTPIPTTALIMTSRRQGTWHLQPCSSCSYGNNQCR